MAREVGADTRERTAGLEVGQDAREQLGVDRRAGLRGDARLQPKAVEHERRQPGLHRAHGTGRLATNSVTSWVITTSPLGFVTVSRSRTIPRSGCEREGRASMHSVS